VREDRAAHLHDALRGLCWLPPRRPAVLRVPHKGPRLVKARPIDLRPNWRLRLRPLDQDHHQYIIHRQSDSRLVHVSSRGDAIMRDVCPIIGKLRQKKPAHLQCEFRHTVWKVCARCHIQQAHQALDLHPPRGLPTSQVHHNVSTKLHTSAMLRRPSSS
jgi:hypothetical protein